MTAVALHYTVDGPDDAAIVVLGSSLGTTNELWQPQMSGLCKRFRVVRYDHRGHGRSSVPARPVLTRRRGWRRLGAVRPSRYRAGPPRRDLARGDGGDVGGAHVPERVDRLALVCTSAHLGPPEMWAQRVAARTLVVADSRTPPLRRRTLRRSRPGFALASWRSYRTRRTWRMCPARTFVTQLLVDFLGGDDV